MQHVRRMRFSRIVILLITIAGITEPLSAQVALQARIWLGDKGTTERFLSPGEEFYDEATAHLTPRALQRRAKVLSHDQQVSTRDLPIVTAYRAQIESLGVVILQSSRWFNTLLVFGDTTLFSSIESLPFVDSVSRLAVIAPAKAVARQKELSLTSLALSPPIVDPRYERCITGGYGYGADQLERIGTDHLHRIGISGDGVLVGILDAGFDWSHPSLKNAEVVAEWDFVNDDGNTADEAGQTPSRSHGTLVMSVIGGIAEHSLVGVAPDASFALAKTEDIASETPVEEDNFVAGLEWLESLGVDITNTSLGYTTFDPPYLSHSDRDLDGSTAFASRGLNYAAYLGVLNVTSAGNEYTTFRQVGVPAEADSALAVGALDAQDSRAGFSSSGSSGDGRIKPEISAPGVGIFGADFDHSSGYRAVQGTSLAAPLVTGAAALLLSADPTLTADQIRKLLTGTAAQAASPDTLVGSGRVAVDSALSVLAARNGITGAPLLRAESGNLQLALWVAFSDVDAVDEGQLLEPLLPFTITIENTRADREVSSVVMGPPTGLLRWTLRDAASTLDLQPGDSLRITTSLESRQTRSYFVEYERGGLLGDSRLCFTPLSPSIEFLTTRPNPMIEGARVEFQLLEDARVRLDLFSSSGERVMSILSGETLNAGFHSLLVIPDDLPSGAYYYRLMVGDELYSWPAIRLR